jgi:dienelactone hydrolase
VGDKLKEALAAAKVRAEIEVFPNARHGFTVPDSRSAANTADADCAGAKLLTLYKREL